MYEGVLRMADQIAGEIIQAVDGISDPEDTLVFVLSDHGENLGDHGHVGHIFNLYDSNLRIVCIARGPGMPVGAVDERLVHITDVYRTALGAAGVVASREAGGLDLRGQIPEDRVVYASLEYPHISLGLFPAFISERGLLDSFRVRLQAAIGPRFKLIRSIDEGGRVVREEIYDILVDPGETRPLERDVVDARVLRKLEQTLSRHGSFATIGTRRSQDDLTEEEREGLRALGYLGDEGMQEDQQPSGTAADRSR
jgi:arylsulfatase A-like enzyme